MQYKLVNKTTKRACLTAMFGAFMFATVSLYAAKGETKAKKGYVLKFNGFELKSMNNSAFSMKQGFSYKGSFSNIEKAPQQTTLQSIITFQKGNTTFIYPYKHAVTLPKFKTPERNKF